MRHPEQLMFSPHARIFDQGETVVVDSPRSTHTFVGRAAKIIRLVRFDLDGSLTVGAIAQRHAVHESDIIKVVSSLVDERLLVDVAPLLEEADPGQFLKVFYPLCDEWGLGVFAHPFWTDFATGRASYNVVIGWGVEFYHRVMGADEHNAIAMRRCYDDVVKAWLTEHFREEVDHGVMFLDGLSAVGLERQAVEASPPLPSTRGLIGYLNALAASNLLAYLGCYAVMHSPRVGQTADKIALQFDAWNAMYPKAVPMLNKIREHAMLDVGLGHEEIVFEKVLLLKNEVSAVERAFLLAAAHGITQAFTAFFCGIQLTYGELECEVPRQVAS